LLQLLERYERLGGFFNPAFSTRAGAYLFARGFFCFPARAQIYFLGWAPSRRAAQPPPREPIAANNSRAENRKAARKRWQALTIKHKKHLEKAAERSQTSNAVPVGGFYVF
jgi:hypothetical protein